MMVMEIQFPVDGGMVYCDIYAGLQARQAIKSVWFEVAREGNGVQEERHDYNCPSLARVPGSSAL